jgi:serine/threonine protein kinase
MPFSSSSLAQSGRYTNIRIIGQGGYGLVYAATDRVLTREVAIKEVLHTHKKFTAALNSFNTEARLQARLNHSNIVLVYDVVEDPQDRDLYLISEYVKGGSLGNYLRTHGPLNQDVAIQVALQMCVALEVTMREDIVHGDIKPPNIVLVLGNQGRINSAKLIDFGSAIDRREAQFTPLPGQTTIVPGQPVQWPVSPPYMAPELARMMNPSDVDVRADLYSLGLVIWEMLTNTVYKSLSPQSQNLADYVVHPKVGLAEVIAKAIQHDPAQRYQTPQELAQELRAVRDGHWVAPTVVLSSGTPQANVAPTVVLSSGTPQANVAPTVVLSSGTPQANVAPTVVTLKGRLATVVGRWRGLSTPGGVGTLIVAFIIILAVSGQLIASTSTPTSSTPVFHPTLQTTAVAQAPSIIPPTEIPVAPTEIPVALTEIPVVPTEIPVAPTEIPVVPTELPIAPTQTSVPLPYNKPIVFQSYRTGNWDLWLVYPDGNGLRQLTSSNGDNVSPAWSPDGQMIAFVSNRDGDDDIYVMNADGSGQRAITNNNHGDRDPAWSPDGRIVYSSRATPDWDVFVMNGDGSESYPITADYSDEFNPSWSPDGEWIAFTTNANGYDHIKRIQAEGTGRYAENIPENAKNRDPRDIANSFYKWNDKYPVWKPTKGGDLAFASAQNGNWEIYVVDMDGRKPSNRTNHPSNDTEPSWSPDGSFITFTTNRDGNQEIYIMNADGSNQRNLTNISGDDSNPAWSP